MFIPQSNLSVCQLYQIGLPDVNQKFIPQSDLFVCQLYQTALPDVDQKFIPQSDLFVCQLYPCTDGLLKDAQQFL